MKTLFFLLLLPTFSFGQDYNNFSWKEKEIEFTGTELKAQDSKTGKLIFNGAKESHIKIHPVGSDPNTGFISVKLGDYLEIDQARITKFQHTQDEETINIIYSAQSGIKLFSINLSYKPGSTKPSFIIVASSDDYTSKTSKTLTFTVKEIQ
jgi:hypothetical protein